MNTVMRNKVEVTQPKPIIMTSVALRARGLLALTCKSARQCAAGMPGRAPENYGKRGCIEIS